MASSTDAGPDRRTAAPGPDVRTERAPAGPPHRPGRPIEVPHIRDCPSHRTAAAGDGWGPRCTHAGADLADVLTSHRADVTRLAAWLRLGFLGVLALASALEDPGEDLVPLPQAAVLAGYGALVLAVVAARRHLPARRSPARPAMAMLCADIAVVVVLQAVSDGSPALALALFLVPMSAGFQLRVRHTALITLACFASYLALLLLDASLRERVGDRNTLAVLAFLVLACLACVVVSRQYQDRQARIRQLVCERAHLLAEVMRAEERERASLAELLHDGPLQSVLAVRLELGTTARGPAAPDDVATARDRLLDVSRQLRDLTTALHPLMLEAKGIGHVLCLLADNTAERTGLEGVCTVNVQQDTGRPGHPDPPDPRESLVFTAVRELLNNVVTHARATGFEVSLTDEAGTWRLEVGDDGLGIAPGELRGKLLEGHIGLASLRVRIEAADGTMTISSGPRGTSVLITLPPPATGRGECCRP
ncbi:sensor histidine kinase [Streptomyces sp. NPDC001594]|uniref:sensor histidine kinase n=1 Tax=Streptomyces sp. NPDC001594 TaxID=3364590 RepID=UPI0036874233